MTQIESNIDEFILRLKNDAELQDFAFTKAYSRNYVPNPIDKFVVAVNTLDTKIKKEFIGKSIGENIQGKIYETKVRLRVYAKTKDHASSLVEATYTLSSALQNHDTENLIDTVSLTGISYDSTVKTVYRDIEIIFCYCLCEGETA